MIMTRPSIRRNTESTRMIKAIFSFGLIKMSRFHVSGC